MSDIFKGAPGFYGYFSPMSDNNVAITFTRKGGTTNADDSDVSAFFLVDRYDLNWARPVTVKHSLNVDKPVAIVGYGNGTLVVTGMIGKAEQFAKLFDGEDDLCDPLTCEIDGGKTGKKCDSNSDIRHAKIALSGLIPSSIVVTGQVDQMGVVMQTANAVFTVTGVKLDAGSNTASGGTDFQA